MITKETLKIINADLDVEMAEVLSNRTDATDARKPKVKTFLVEEVNQGVNQRMNQRMNQAMNQGMDPTQEDLKQLSDGISSEPNAEDTEHMKLHRLIVKILDVAGWLFAIKFDFYFIPHRHFNYYTTNMLLTSFWSSVLYTQYVHYTNREYLRILEPFSLYGQGISCTLNWISYNSYKNRTAALLLYTEHLCKKNLSGDRAHTILKELKEKLKFIKLFVFAILSCVSAFLIVPLKVYIEEGIFIPLLPVKVPFVDGKTLSGAIVTNIIQILQGTISGIAISIHGGTFISEIGTYALQIELIAHDFKALDRMWNDTNNLSLAYKRAYLINIFKKRQDINYFLDEIKFCNESKLFVYFCASYFSQIVVLFEITKSDFISGYCLAIGLCIEMMFYCVMGAKITIANDKFFDTVCDTNWYMYDLQSQKMIQLLLHESHITQEIMLGPIGPLNVVTGITVVKSIYSYYTVLQELF